MCSRLAVGWCVVGFGWEVLGCSGDGVMHNVDPHCSFIRRFGQEMLVRHTDYMCRVFTFWRAEKGPKIARQQTPRWVRDMAREKDIEPPATGGSSPALLNSLTAVSGQLALDSAVAKPTRRSPFGEISCRRTAVWAIDRLVLRHDGQRRGAGNESVEIGEATVSELAGPEGDRPGMEVI
jgi:hypothetical protein